MNLPACKVRGNAAKGQSLAADGDAEDRLAYVRNFLSLPPAKRWARSNLTQEKTNAHQIRGYGGRGTWERFRTDALDEHRWLEQKARRNGDVSPQETWSILDQQDAPPGWSALDVLDAYIENADTCGGVSECITVRDRNRADGIAGFVVYGMVLYAEIVRERKQTHRTVSFDLHVDIQQIYVRPSYRRRNFGLALCFGLSERLKNIVEHGLTTQPAAHTFRVDDITLCADCYSEEGDDWMASLEAAVDFWVASSHCGQALKSTTVTGDFGL